MIHAGVIRNLKSHRNQKGGAAGAPAGVLEALPQDADELHETLAWFASSGVGLIVMDGGDGTVRDVLSRLPPAYLAKPPKFAVLPKGKTNALALDLGMGMNTRLEAVLAAAQAGRFKGRHCLEVVRKGAEAPELRGFLFGIGAFVRWTELAQKTHGLGFFNNAAIGMTIAGAAARLLTAGPSDTWRQGEAATVAFDGGEVLSQDWFLILSSSLKRFPLSLKPFGAPHEGLKVLSVAAPPRHLGLAALQVFRGSQASWLARAGYRRDDADRVALSWTGDFTLDGEIFAGGDLEVRQGPELEFVIA